MATGVHRHRLRAVVFSVAALAGSGIAAYLTEVLPSRSASVSSVSLSDALHVPTSALDWGTVWEQRAFEFTLPVENVSDRSVVVGNLRASCNCTELSPRSFTLPPGQTQIVTGKVDLTRGVSFRSGAEQPFLLHLSGGVARDAQSQPHAVEWVLRCRVRRALEVSPAKVHLSGAWEVVRHHYSPTIDICVKPERPVSELKPVWDSSELTVEFLNPAPGADDIYELRVTPAIDLPVGPFHSEIVLRTEFADGSGGTDVVIPLEGRVSPPVRLVPSLVTLRTGAAPSDNAPRSREVAAAQLVGRDGQQWIIGGVEDCPDWLTWSGTPEDQIAGILKLSVSDDIPSGTHHTITVAVVPPEGRTEQLPVHVVVAGHRLPHAFSE